jgi:hypothetical protein
MPFLLEALLPFKELTNRPSQAHQSMQAEIGDRAADLAVTTCVSCKR